MRNNIIYKIILFIAFFFSLSLSSPPKWDRDINITYLDILDYFFIISPFYKCCIRIDKYEIIESKNQKTNDLFLGKDPSPKYAILIVGIMPSTYLAIENAYLFKKIFIEDCEIVVKLQIYHLNANREIDKMSIEDRHVRLEKKKEKGKFIFSYYSSSNDSIEDLLLFRMVKNAI